MKRSVHILAIAVLVMITITSCESEAAKSNRLEREKQRREELVVREKARLVEEKRKATVDSLEQAKKKELERQEKRIYDKYITNSLSTGAAPFSSCFGKNRACSGNGCSNISVKSPYNSDVIVTIKSNGKVVKHGYIKAGSFYSFEMPNGTYQPFFYYGKGWNPEKEMVGSDCSKLRGGFIADEVFGKDSPQRLSNNILSYELILSSNGNFSTTPSSSIEAF